MKGQEIFKVTLIRLTCLGLEVHKDYGLA